MESTIIDKSNFSPLFNSKLSDEDVMSIYHYLRFAFEQSHPNNMVDASDAYILTVFPFKRGAIVPDNFDVVNYETGLFEGKPALCKVDGSHEILVFD
ncbi:MAG: hypothetical protein K6F64_03675 [Clostridia bacterium]|nr:hypothetical protein [Clostridia bacterium]